MISPQLRQAEWLEPLQAYYASAGAPLPPITIIEGQDIPEPQRSMLVHHRDMTSVLERFYGGRVELRLLRSRAEDGLYTRQVVLVLAGMREPVEFGAIRIDLGRFAPEPRRIILEGRRPLGGILKEYGIPYVSRPGAFLRVRSDAVMSPLLGLTGEHQLYGRYNVLSDLTAQPLAEVIEILPPARSRGPNAE